MRSVADSPCIWNLYGPAETTLGATYHLIDYICDQEAVPIGYPVFNYQCSVLDSFLQRVTIDQKGELYIGGVGVFAGYLGRDDLTEKVLLDIDGEIFYRTGDLVRMDNNGLLHYIGRKDHQIKLHGQRIELGEIEQCLLNITLIRACVVMKWDDDHLVAYIQSSSVNEDELRHHCQSHLPSYMVPSLFVVLKKFPLNTNGKVDRTLLPPPHFPRLTNLVQTNPLLLTPLEQTLCDIFQEAFHTRSPDVNMSFFQMGGSSLDAIQALSLIQQKISSRIDAGLLFANSSVQQLARAIESSSMTTVML